MSADGALRTLARTAVRGSLRHSILGVVLVSALLASVLQLHLETGARTDELQAIAARLDVTPVALRAELAHVRGRALGHFAWNVGLFSLIGIAVWLLLDRLVVRRIDGLLDVAREVGRGNYAARAQCDGRDEIAVLAGAINQSLARLEDDHALLVSRTRALTERNAQLLSLRHAIDAHAIVSVTDLKGNILFANDKFCEVSGYSRAELRGRNHRILNSRAHPPAMFAELWSTIRRGDAWHGVLQNRAKDGRPYWVQSSILPILGEDGHPRQYISIRTDVSVQERLRVGLEIIADAGHDGDVFQAIARGLAVGLDVRWCGVGVLQSDGTVLSLAGFWNDGEPGGNFSYGVAGTPCEETLRLPAEESYTAEGDALLQRRLFEPGRAAGMNRYHGRCLRDAAGVAIGVIFIADDKPTANAGQECAVLNTAARRAETALMIEADVHELRAQQHHVALLIQAANLGTWEWDITAGRCEIILPALGANQIDERWQFQGDEYLEFVAPEDRSRLRTALAEHLAGRSGFFSCEIRVIMNGETRYYLDRGQVVARDAEGRATRMLGVLVDMTERRQAEAALSLERSRLALAVDGAKLATWDWCIATGQVDKNAYWATMLGYTSDEIAPHVESWRQAVHPDDREEVEAAIAAHLAGTTEVYLSEHRLRTRDGGWLWVLDTGRVTARDAAGRPVRMAGIHLDITERKLAEVKLLERDRKLQLVVQAGRMGFWDWNIDTDELDLHEDIFDTFEVTGPMHCKARDWAWRVHPEDREALVQAQNAHLKGLTEYFDIEARFQTSRRGVLHVLTRGQVVERDTAGRARRMVGVHIDVTQQREAEAALRRQSRDYSFIVEAANIDVWDWHIASDRLTTNAQLMTMLGYPADAGETGVKLPALLHPEDRARVLSSLVAHLKGDAPVYEAEIRYRAADGSWRWVQSFGQVVARDPQGRATRMVGIHVDIHERKTGEATRERLERQLQQAQKMEAIGQLTGGIAHDFNNILASVLGYAALARERFGGDGQGKLAEYLDAVLAASERARELVAKMLAYSRSTPREDLSPVLPSPIVREAVGMLAAMIPSTIEIDCVTVDEETPIVADPTELNQVVINLAVNARDAMNGHGRLSIQIAEPRHVDGTCTSCREEFDGEFVEITIRDTGDGIPPEHLSRIFDPFFTTKEVGKGSGLGLSVVHGILHRGRGHVVVDSRPGHGTCVRLYFRRAAAAPVVHALPRPARSVVPHGTRLLIVEDEIALAGYLKELFEAHEYAVDVAHDGAEALAQVRAAPARYAVIVTDQTMPHMTGLELARELRSVAPAVPILLCTGYGDLIDDALGRRLGIQRVLLKPVPADDLLQAVAALLPVPTDSGGLRVGRT
ncbi:MAG: PAS domain-containing protein [Gammaproteobacteria bacterium]